MTKPPDELDDIIRKLSIQLTTESCVTGKVPEKLYEYESEAAEAIQVLINKARIEGINELRDATTKHLEKIERQEGGGVLDLYAITGAIKHDEDAALARDRLVTERRAVVIVHSIASELKATQGESNE